MMISWWTYIVIWQYMAIWLWGLWRIMTSGWQAICQQQLVKSIRHCYLRASWRQVWPFQRRGDDLRGRCGRHACFSYVLALASPLLRAVLTSTFYMFQAWGTNIVVNISCECIEETLDYDLVCRCLQHYGFVSHAYECLFPLKLHKVACSPV